MPEVDGRMILRLDENQQQVLFWALINRVRALSDERREAEGQEQQLIEAEIIQCGALLEQLPTYRGGRSG